jgi:hypothetical protein
MAPVSRVTWTSPGFEQQVRIASSWVEASTGYGQKVGPPLGMAPDLVGPNQEDLVDMARRTLAARGDTTQLMPSWRNAPFGVEAAGEVLLPGEGARIAETTFDAWLSGIPGPQRR